MNLPPPAHNPVFERFRLGWSLVLPVFGRAALPRRPRIQGRAAALPYHNGEDFCPPPPPRKPKNILLFAARPLCSSRVCGNQKQSIDALLRGFLRKNPGANYEDMKPQEEQH
jgi:hypothetical protein